MQSSLHFFVCHANAFQQLPREEEMKRLTSSYPGWIKSPHVVNLGIQKISDLDSVTIFNGGGGYSGVNFGHPKSEVF